jgi:hypothetical protein
VWDMSPAPWTSHSLKYHYYTLWNNRNSKGANTVHTDYSWLTHLSWGNVWVMNRAWSESCKGPVSQQTHALHVCPHIHIPLTAQCCHTCSNLACILHEITTKESFTGINSLQWHAMNQFWTSSKCTHCNQQHINSNKQSPSWKVNCCFSRNLHDLRLQWSWMLRRQPSVMWLGKQVPIFKSIFSSTLKMVATGSSKSMKQSIHCSVTAQNTAISAVKLPNC